MKILMRIFALSLYALPIEVARPIEALVVLSRNERGQDNLAGIIFASGFERRAQDHGQRHRGGICSGAFRVDH